MRLDEIPAHDAAKRAAVVAAVGGHSILFVGGRGSFAKQLADWNGFCKFSVPATAMWPCPCGYRGDPKHECVCTDDHVIKWLAENTAERGEFDIVVRLEPRYDLAVDFALGRRSGPPDELVYEQIQEARETRSGIAIGSDAVAMLRDVQGHMAIPPDRLKVAVEIARSIAALDNIKEIGPAQLAEAIHYTRR